MTDAEPTTNTFQRPEGLVAHYTSAEVAFEHVLPEGGRLRLSRYADMNDPAEAQDLRMGFGWYGNRSDEEVNATHDQILRTVEEIRGARRLFCLTTDVPGARDTFGCCWARPRMWDRYGDGHRGVCLVFDPGKLRNALEAQMPSKPGPHEPTLHMGRVDYTPGGIAESVPVRHIGGDEVFGNTREAVARHIDTHYHDFYFLKSDDWASEYEYRVLLTSATGEQYAYVDYRNSLAAVFVGYKFPAFQLAGAKQLCDRRGVQLRRMWWEAGRPFALGPGDGA
jgi:hypothetical protein